MSHGHDSKLARLSEGIIEGCWLAALVVTPLFFDIYSHRVFEPDKAVVFRSLALVMALAWMVRSIERRATRIRPEAVPLVVGALLVLLVTAEATVFSVAPQISLRGSYNRLQGLYTTAAYVGVFLSIVGLLRTRAQLERLITTALLTSLPVSLYGIIQYFGTDPMPWAADVTARVTSSMGNPIFVAAFLIMTVPLTMYRLMESGGTVVRGQSTATNLVLIVGGLVSLAFQMVAWLSGPTAGTASAAITIATWVVTALLLRKTLRPFLRISLYTVLLSAQLMCILFSQSRGPWLAMGGGLFLLALLWTLIQRRRARALATIGAGLTIAVAVVAVNWPGSPLGFVREIPYLGRAGQMTKIEGGSGRVRVLIWEGVSDLIADDPVRAVVGYGPETLGLVYPPHHRPELGRINEPDALADRSHNEIFDVLVTTGAVGLVVYVLFMTGLFYYGLRWIGLLATRIRRWTFLGLWSLGGIAAVSLIVLMDGGWRFSGIAFPIGLFVGLLVYLCGCALTLPEDQAPSVEDEPRITGPLQLVVAAVLAMVATHFLEIQVGLAIVATQVYFWIFAAALVACSTFVLRKDALRRSRRPGPVTASFAVSLILITLVYDFYLPDADLSRLAPALWLVGFASVFGAFIVLTETDRPWNQAIRRYGLFALVPTLLYVAVHVGMLWQGVGEQNLLFGFFGVLLATVLVAGFASIPCASESGQGRSYGRWVSYLVLFAGMLFAVKTTNLDVIRADIHFRKASRDLGRNQYPQAVAELKRAVSLEPKQDNYHLFLGKALLEQAQSVGSPDSLMHEAELALLRARELSPRDPNHTANLARLYLAWAAHTPAGQERTDRLREAVVEFGKATILSPNMPPLWNERGRAYVAAGDTASAEGMYRHALELDEEFFQTYLLVGDLRYVQKRWNEAASAYEEVLRHQPQLLQVRLRLAIAKSQADRQEADEVLEIR